MKDSRLIRLIRTFSKEELKSFRKFLESPFLKPARNTISLFDYIAKYYPEYHEKDIKKEKVFGKLFKGEDYNEKKLFNLIFDLTKAAEDFLAHNTLKEDETEFLLNLSKGYLNKNLKDESFRVNKLIQKKLRPGFSPSLDYVSKLRRLTHLQGAYFIQKNDFGNLIGSKVNYFEVSAIQFIIDLSEIMSIKKPAMNTYGNNMESLMVDAITQSFDIKNLLSILERSNYDKKSLITLHYYILKIYEEPDNVSYYYKLRDTFYNSLEEYDREERCLVFSKLVNYCVPRSVGDMVEFKKEGLEVYKRMVSSNSYSFFEDDYMDVVNYRNIVQYCISLKDTVWLETFLEMYSDKIQPGIRDDLKNLSFASLYFIKCEYEKALVECSKINNEFFLFKTDFKTLMLKIYYELEYFEQAYSLIDSYKHFLANSKEIPDSFREIIGNFVKYYSDILKIKSHSSKESPEFIKQKIEKESKIVNKSWLIEKSNELLKKKHSKV
ncbi:MAG: hypothetical protein SGI89_05815 [bacterium]|nr:hypothetical protein [bacterium]